MAGRLRRQGQGRRAAAEGAGGESEGHRSELLLRRVPGRRPSSRDEAIVYLERALQAPARPGRQSRRRRPPRGGPRAAGASSRHAEPRAASADRRRCRLPARGNAARVRAARRCAARSRRPDRCRLGLPARPVEAFAQACHRLGRQAAPSFSTSGARAEAQGHRRCLPVRSARRCRADCAAAPSAGARRREAAACRRASAGHSQASSMRRRSASGRQVAHHLLDDGAHCDLGSPCAGRSPAPLATAPASASTRRSMRSRPAPSLASAVARSAALAGAAHHVPLGAQHGQRRAQLVRGIGGEAALAREQSLRCARTGRSWHPAGASARPGPRSSVPAADRRRRGPAGRRSAGARARGPGARPRPSRSAAPASTSSQGITWLTVRPETSSSRS